MASSFQRWIGEEASAREQGHGVVDAPACQGGETTRLHQNVECTIGTDGWELRTPPACLHLSTTTGSSKASRTVGWSLRQATGTIVFLFIDVFSIYDRNHMRAGTFGRYRGGYT